MRKMRLLGLVSFFTVMLIASLVAAGSYTSSPGAAIPNNDSGGMSDTITVPDWGTVSHMDVYLKINHTAVGDLIINLTSPSGTTVNLVDRIGVPITTFGCIANNIDVWLADGAATSIEDSCNSQHNGGTFSPMGSLSTFAGEPVNGTWTLTVSDVQFGDAGSLNSWTLNFPGTSVQDSAMINDGRLNAYDLAAPVAIYPDNGGISIFSIDPATGDGALTARLSADDLQAAPPAQAAMAAEVHVTLPDGSVQIIPVDPSAISDLVGDLSAGNTELFTGTHAFFSQPIFVHRLDTGEYQVTAYDLEGHIYTFILIQ